jgi:hypothetical protein
MFRTLIMLLLALAIAYGGVALARYAEADDAPGGVVVGALMVLGAVALAGSAFGRRNRSGTNEAESR